MPNKFLSKLPRSLVKLILPFFSKLFIKLRINRRIINFLAEKSYYANNHYDFSKKISQLIQEEKLTALDIGAQGGFNSDNFFPKKYESFFDAIMIEPNTQEFEKIQKKYKYVINKGLWGSKIKKKFFILGNRVGSSSFFEPDKSTLPIHRINEKDYSNYDVTNTLEIDCNTLSSELKNIGVNKLDYLKIDTQGSEFEILKGIENYRPLLIRTEVHINSMYKNAPEWSDVINILKDLNYMAIDFKPIGSHATRIPAEADMIFIPNFKNQNGENIIKERKNKFLSLLLIFGQIDLLKVIISNINLSNADFINEIDDKYFF